MLVAYLKYLHESKKISATFVNMMCRKFLNSYNVTIGRSLPKIPHKFLNKGTAEMFILPKLYL